MTLQEFLEENGYETRSYSGRAMFGKTCLAVTVSDPVIAAQNIGYGIGVHSEQVEDELRSVKAIRWDQMGLQYILYWPYEKYTDSDTETEVAGAD